MLEDWGKKEDATRANAATDTVAAPVTDETLASALLEDWGLTDGGRKTDPRYAGLTDSQKAEIRQQSGWSDGLIAFIRSADEARLYMQFDLQEYTINDRLCLIPRELDLDTPDNSGKTNRERLKAGDPPLASDGCSYEVHHIGQKMDSPLAVLSNNQHHKNGNDSVLHNKKQRTAIDRNAFKKQKAAMWKELLRQIEEKESES